MKRVKGGRVSGLELGQRSRRVRGKDGNEILQGQNKVLRRRKERGN